MQHAGDVQRRGVPHIIGIRLERGTQHGDIGTQQGSAARYRGQLDHPRPPPHIDAVHLAQECQSVTGPQLPGPRHECANVLRQAATAESEAGVEKSASDARVMPERVSE